MERLTFLDGPRDTAMYALVGLAMALWIYTILWVAKDISRRTNHFGFQLFCILLILFLTPIIGLPIYLLVRPMQHIPADHEDSSFVMCYTCHRPNDTNFAFCVFCGESLKVACPHCKEPVGSDYTYCARCGEEIEEKRQNKKKGRE